MNWLLIVFIVYVVSYLLLEILWIYIEEEDGGFLDYIIDGIWYSKFKKRYVLKQAPKGAIINFTPKDGKMVIMGGKKYYKCKGVFYKKTKDSLYEVTSP